MKGEVLAMMVVVQKYPHWMVEEQLQTLYNLETRAIGLGETLEQDLGWQEGTCR